MKKVFALVLAVLLLVTCLAGCGKFTCDMCGQEKTGKKQTSELFGQKITICADCSNGLSQLGSLFG